MWWGYRARDACAFRTVTLSSVYINHRNRDTVFGFGRMLCSTLDFMISKDESSYGVSKIWFGIASQWLERTKETHNQSHSILFNVAISKLPIHLSELSFRPAPPHSNLLTAIRAQTLFLPSYRFSHTRETLSETCFYFRTPTTTDQTSVFPGKTHPPDRRRPSYRSASGCQLVGRRFSWQIPRRDWPHRAQRYAREQTKRDGLADRHALVCEHIDEREISGRSGSFSRLVWHGKIGWESRRRENLRLVQINSNIFRIVWWCMEHRFVFSFGNNLCLPFFLVLLTIITF